MRKGFFVLPLLAIYIGLTGVQNGLAYGRTRLGRELELSIRNAGFDLGPFRAGLQFILRNAGYDSNVYYGATLEPVEDYTFTIGPAFNIYLPIKKKIIFHVYESPQYVYFKETVRERTWNNFFQGNVHFLFNRFVFTAGAGRSEARERWNTEIDIRVLRKEQSVQGAVFWQPTGRTSFNFSMRAARHDYGETAAGAFHYAEKLNRDEVYYNFTAYRDITSRRRLFLDAEYAYYDFENRSNMKNSRSYGAYSGLEFSPFGKIRGTVKIGYKYLDSIWPQRKDFSGLVGDSNVSIRLLRTVSLRASYRRDVQFSVWQDNTYFLENWHGAGASLYLSRNIRLDYDYNRGKNDYPEEFGVEKRLDNYRIHAVGIYIRLQRNTAFGIIASRWLRESTVDWANDDRDFLGFNLTYDF